VTGVDDSRQLTADSFQFEEGFGEIGGGGVGEVGATDGVLEKGVTSKQY